MSLIMSKPPLHTHAAAVYPTSSALVEKYTLESRFADDDGNASYPLYLEQGGHLWIPRNLAPSLGKDLRDNGHVAGFANNFKPKNEEQARVVDEVNALLKLGKSYICQAPTGFGKTYVGCAAAASVNRKTLVITTKEDLIDHWVGAAQAVLGLGKNEVGIWRGDQCPGPECKFVVALVQSVLKGPARYGAEAFTGFGLVIADEVHRMGADQFSQAMWWLPAKLRLGLSATPYRKDGKDVVFQSHIGNVLVTATQEVMVPNVIMKKTGWRVPRRLEKPKNGGPAKMVQVGHSSGRTMHMIKAMQYDTRRNIIIAKFVRLAYEKGRTTIVFSETMGHLKAMRDTVLKTGVPASDIGWYVGLDSDVYEGSAKSKKEQREKAKIKRVIFATYKMCSEGTDIPWLDTCVLGAPRSDVTQIVGRIRREYPDKKQPLVFDPVDSDSSVFSGYAKQRVTWYKTLKCKINVYA